METLKQSLWNGLFRSELFGGCRLGELTIVSGQPGAGKSTILNQMACDFINQGEKVFYYSGEFPKAKAKRWLYTVLAGQKI